VQLTLTDAQRAARDSARRFAKERILPLAGQLDREQAMPATLLDCLRADGWLGAGLPAQWGGGGMDPVAYGLATEEIGKACSSVRSFLTVHNMAAQSLLRFGSAEQKTRFLPDLCSGRRLIAFALTEPDAGSSGNSIRTEAVEQGEAYSVSGTKIWVTAGLVADLYLVFARCGDKPVALVVERESAGLAIEPMTEALGTRGSMLARLRFDNVMVPSSQRIGAVGAGISFVANAALDHGRSSVAWGATGIIRACLEACLSYSVQRSQAGRVLADHQLIRRQLTDMLVAHTSARALCIRSAGMRMSGNPRAAMETTLAKYHAADAAVRAATNAVRLHGANGYSTDFPVERYLRDATLLEIIEGTKEVHQVGLASYALQWPHVDD
jgi:alkylation response protein AidB-like acyl-CoA dehydrogenase